MISGAIDQNPYRPPTEVRLARIASAHCIDVDENCYECGHPWPCPTNLWATSDLRFDPFDRTDPAEEEQPTC